MNEISLIVGLDFYLYWTFLFMLNYLGLFRLLCCFLTYAKKLQYTICSSNALQHQPTVKRKKRRKKAKFKRRRPGMGKTDDGEFILFVAVAFRFRYADLLVFSLFFHFVRAELGKKWTNEQKNDDAWINTHTHMRKASFVKTKNRIEFAPPTTRNQKHNLWNNRK